MTWSHYHRVTRTATYGFLSALPLLLIYEGLVVFASEGQIASVRVGAEIWLRSLLSLIGGTGFAVLGIAVILVGIGILLYERRRNIPLRARYFGWMGVESAAYAIVLAFLISGAVGRMFAVVPPGGMAGEGLWTQIGLSVGAGVYEELFFRVLLVGGLFLLLREMMTRPMTAYIVAALIGAAIFSGVHHMGPYGDPFTWSVFTYRFLFGLALNAVFLWRGFGIAAWTHALYNVMIVVGVLG